MTVNHEPIAETKDGRVIYDNALTCVCLLVEEVFYDSESILLVRRGIQPGKGLLALPGGYQMRGETWQEGGVRETLEETGVEVELATVTLHSVETTPNGTNLIFAHAIAPGEGPANFECDEVQEIVRTSMLGSIEDWAFPLHYHAARHMLRELRAGA